MNNTVLLAESSSLLTETISRALREAGFKVISFQDGNEAALFALKNKIACIVSDIYLKTISGCELCSVIKDSGYYNTVPFVLFSPEEKIPDFWIENSGADRLVYIQNADFGNLISAIRECLTSQENTAVETESVETDSFIQTVPTNIDLSVAAIHSMERINHYRSVLNSVLNLTSRFNDMDSFIGEVFSILYSISIYDAAAIFLNQEPIQCYYSGFQEKDFTGSSFYTICMDDFQKQTARTGRNNYDIKPVSGCSLPQKEFSAADQFCSYIFFPVEGSFTVGTVHIASKQKNFFNYKVTSTLGFLCRKLGAVLEMAISYKKSIIAEKRLRSAFSKYVPEEIIDGLLKADNVEKQAANEKRKVSILICDIRNFTAISEINQPESVVSFLNGYFSKMVDIIKSHGGSIDKFMGDAIMALFGAPISYIDNAKRALDAALEMVSIIPEIPCSLLNFPPGISFDIGVGIHYGEVIVGNIGCKDKTDYTVIGDSANLASRLEGLTKQYGSRIIISDAVRKELGKGYNLLQIDTVKVKGKTQISQIYRADLKPLNKDYVQQYQKGLSLYINGAFNLALPYFEQALQFVQNDKSAELMKNRCIEFSKNPPQNWDGAIVLTSK